MSRSEVLPAPRGEAARSRALPGGVAAAVAGHLALCLLLQVESFALYVRPRLDAAGTLAFLARLPFLQLENLAVALALLLIGAAAAPRSASRLVFLVLLLAANLYLVLDQIGYRLYHDHLRFSVLKTFDGFSMVLGSARAEVAPVVWLNALLWLILAVWTAGRLRRGAARTAPAPAPISGRRAGVAVAAAVAYVGASVAAARHPGNERLQHHPLLRLADDLLRFGPAAGPRAAPGVYLADYERPRATAAGEASGTSGTGPAALAGLLEAARAARPPLDIVLVVLESVGARQLFRGDLPDPDLAPNIHRLARQAAVLDTVYTVHASSVNTHVTLMTGGLAMDLKPYAGPTLVGLLAERGYHTALFSSARLDGQGFLGLVELLHYDRVWDFGAQPPAFQAAHNLHSWGGREESAVAAAVAWIDQVAADGRPLFLHYYTTATHHPYSTPPGWPQPATGPAPEERHRAALRYSDHAVGILIDALRARGRLDRTLVVVTGDHGEALGRIHPGERLHGTRLYDETLRDFLVIANPRLFAGTVRPRRVAQVRDLFPTLLAFLDPRPLLVPGQNLFDPAYHPRVVYFATEELCGLRDGDWKQISSHDGSTRELYHLGSDPDELRNLAELRPDLVELYRAMCHSYQYDVGRLERARMRALAEARAGGPAALDAVEFRPADDDAAGPAAYFPPGCAGVVALSRWTPVDRPRELRYWWRAPDGSAGGGPLRIEAGAASASIVLRAPGGLTPGVWTWLAEEGDEVLRLGRFSVAAGRDLD